MFLIQIPTPSPTGQIPIQQGTSAGVQFLMLNPNLDLSSFSNPFASADGKGLSVTKSTQSKLRLHMYMYTAYI